MASPAPIACGSGPRPLKARRYRLTVTATDAAGNRSAALTEEGPSSPRASVEDMDPLLELAAQLGAEHVEAAPERHVGWRAEAAELRAALRARAVAPRRGRDAVLRERRPTPNRPGDSRRRATSASSIGGALPVARAPDRLTAAWTRTPVATACSPTMSVVEELAGSWVRELLGLPAGVSHGFATGCQMAHVTGLAVARHFGLVREAGRTRSAGCTARRQCASSSPDDRHITVDAAVRLLGLGAREPRPVDLPDSGARLSDALERKAVARAGRANHRDRAGGQREHRLVRGLRGRLPPCARARRVGPCRRRVRAVGRRERAPARAHGRHRPR